MKGGGDKVTMECIYAILTQNNGRNVEGWENKLRVAGT